MRQRTLGAELHGSAIGLGMMGTSGFYGAPDEAFGEGDFRPPTPAGERCGELGMSLADA